MLVLFCAFSWILSRSSGNYFITVVMLLSWSCSANLLCYLLTHWGRVMHICVSKLTIIGSNNGLSPGRRQAIIWNNTGILLIRSLGTNFSEILSKIHTFSFKKIHLKMSVKWRQFCLSLNVLTPVRLAHGDVYVMLNLDIPNWFWEPMYW